MRNPFFSIIVPAYNAESFIRKGLDSIHSQCFKDYELIVVCDSCTDHTEDIAKSYGAITIPVSHHLDSLSRNTGIDAARGDYILFMDDDGWFLHEFAFQQIHDKLLTTDVDILAFAFIYRNVGVRSHTPFSYFPAVWNKCWRRNAIGGVRFPPVPSTGNADFHKEMFLKIPPNRIMYWGMPLYYYNYLRPGSITYNQSVGLPYGYKGDDLNAK